ncbi:hypothetical protein [Photorhabdus sp. RW14-46]|uniref:hypothetical protein n=1 Tax=Photorhabdus sp. RW14-46 TaxID=2100168 RepID=UPI0013F40710|nr:hypothetical protein [Photorhabdus sp. RW14-46]
MADSTKYTLHLLDSLGIQHKNSFMKHRSKAVISDKDYSSQSLRSRLKKSGNKSDNSVYTLWISRWIATARERIPGSIENYVTGVSECSQQRGNLKDDGYKSNEKSRSDRRVKFDHKTKCCGKMFWSTERTL